MREREESSDVRKGPEEILFLFVFLNPGGPFILFILFIYFGTLTEILDGQISIDEPGQGLRIRIDGRAEHGRRCGDGQ